jgi:hypothetical protein
MRRRHTVLIMLALVAFAIAMSGCSTNNSSSPSSPSEDPGELFGYVLHALTGSPIEGATVSADGSSTTTDETGYYLIEDVEPGDVTIQASFDDFVTVWEDVYVHGGESLRQDCVLLPTTAGEEYRFVLTWGSDPADLDSHIWVPVSEGVYSHVYYAYRGSVEGEPYAELDVDDVTGYGPETITVLPEHEGEYAYSVYHFSGNGTLDTSQARVRIYQGNDLLYSLTVPDDVSDDNWWWNVCWFDAQTGNFTIVDELDPYSPTFAGPMRMTK